jgi:FixJ family two-component response regulator
VGTYEDLLRHREEVLESRLMILDINLGVGVPSGVDAYRWLRAHGFPGTVVFLTGHARTHPEALEARKLPGVRVLEKPVGVDVLGTLLAEARG